MNTTKTVSAKKTQGDKPEFLSILKKSLSIIMLSAIGAGAVMYIIYFDIRINTAQRIKIQNGQCVVFGNLLDHISVIIQRCIDS